MVEEESQLVRVIKVAAKAASPAKRNPEHWSGLEINRRRALGYSLAAVAAGFLDIKYCSPRLPNIPKVILAHLPEDPTIAMVYGSGGIPSFERFAMFSDHLRDHPVDLVLACTAKGGNYLERLYTHLYKEAFHKAGTTVNRIEDTPLLLVEGNVVTTTGEAQVAVEAAADYQKIKGGLVDLVFFHHPHQRHDIAIGMELMGGPYPDTTYTLFEAGNKRAIDLASEEEEIYQLLDYPRYFGAKLFNAQDRVSPFDWSVKGSYIRVRKFLDDALHLFEDRTFQEMGSYVGSLVSGTAQAGFRVEGLCGFLEDVPENIRDSDRFRLGFFSRIARDKERYSFSLEAPHEQFIQDVTGMTYAAGLVAYVLMN